MSGASQVHQGLCGALPRSRQRQTGADPPTAALLGGGNASAHRGARRDLALELSGELSYGYPYGGVLK